MGKSILQKQKPKRLMTRLKATLQGVSWLIVTAGLGFGIYYYMQNHASGFDQYRIKVRFLDTLPEDIKVQKKIKKLVEHKAKKAGSLDELASAIHKKFGFSFSNIRLQADELVVSIKRRESMAHLLAWDKAWGLDSQAELFPLDSKKGSKRKGEVLLTDFLSEISKQPAMEPLGTLVLPAKAKAKLEKALKLIRVAKSKNIRLKKIEFTKGRGLVFYERGRSTKIIVGHTQFHTKLGRYKQTVAKLGAKKAVSIGLDFANKAIIKYDERL